MAVHSGVFGAARPPFTLVLAGCLIPDLPWILRRVAIGSGLAESSADLIAYCIFQASLAGTLAACLAVGLVHRNWLTFAALAWLGCALHLALDALQDKWGNGVHFLAPFDWSLMSAGFLDIESPVFTIATVAGLLPFLFLRRIRFDANSIVVTRTRCVAVLLLAATYFALPLMFVDEVVESNVRYLRTLDTEGDRIGRRIELDRQRIYRAGESLLITTHTSEVLEIAGPTDTISEGIHSVRGTFVAQNKIEISDRKTHTAWRDIASYLGVTLSAAWCMAVLYVRFFGRPTAARENDQ